MRFLSALSDKVFGPAPDTRIAACLESQAALAVEGAQVFADSKCRDVDNIVRLERQGDKIELEVHRLIDEAFQLRFFDKRDVEHLTRELDNVLDGIKDVAKHVAVNSRFFKNNGLPDEARRLLEIIKEMVARVETLTKKLESRHMPLNEVNPLVDELDGLESAADAILFTMKSVLLERYYPDGDKFEYDAWQDFYRLLETVTDNANRCGSLILSIARK